MPYARLMLRPFSHLRCQSRLVLLQQGTRRSRMSRLLLVKGGDATLVQHFAINLEEPRLMRSLQVAALFRLTLVQPCKVLSPLLELLLLEPLNAGVPQMSVRGLPCSLAICIDSGIQLRYVMLWTSRNREPSFMQPASLVLHALGHPEQSIQVFQSQYRPMRYVGVLRRARNRRRLGRG